jgi:hypothetical protein
MDVQADGINVFSECEGDPQCPTGKIRDLEVAHSLVIRAEDTAFQSGGAEDALWHHLTSLTAARYDFRFFVRDDNLGSANSFDFRDSLNLGQGEVGVLVEGYSPNDFSISSVVSTNNEIADFLPSEAIAAQALSVTPELQGCVVYVPEASPLKGAGTSGSDIGATILYRYRNGELTDVPLWNRVTGEFPCSSIVSGLNDEAGASCGNVHLRLNLGPSGCPLP